MAKKKQLRIKLVHSATKCVPRHKACVQGLGLRRLHQEVILDDNPCIRGMVNKVSYLLEIEQIG